MRDVTYYRDAEGVVHLSGAARGQGVATPPGLVPVDFCGGGPYIFVLPEGYRPPRLTQFAVPSGGSTGEVDVNPDGEVLCVVGHGDKYVSLDGIAFHAG